MKSNLYLPDNWWSAFVIKCSMVGNRDTRNVWTSMKMSFYDVIFATKPVRLTFTHFLLWIVPNVSKLHKYRKLLKSVTLIISKETVNWKVKLWNSKTENFMGTKQWWYDKLGKIKNTGCFKKNGPTLNCSSSHITCKFLLTTFNVKGICMTF